VSASHLIHKENIRRKKRKEKKRKEKKRKEKKRKEKKRKEKIKTRNGSLVIVTNRQRLFLSSFLFFLCLTLSPVV
jgi:hypothetical protein